MLDEKKCRETTYSKSNGDAQKRANDLELKLQNLTNIIQKQKETNIQLQSELQSQSQLIENH